MLKNSKLRPPPKNISRWKNIDLKNHKNSSTQKSTHPKPHLDNPPLCTYYGGQAETGRPKTISGAMDQKTNKQIRVWMTVLK